MWAKGLEELEQYQDPKSTANACKNKQANKGPAHRIEPSMCVG